MQENPASRKDRILLVLILLLGASLRLSGLAFGLPHPETRPDETTIVVVATGLLYAGLNPHFFHWPSLMFYVVSAIYRVGWEIGHLRGIFRLKFDMFRDAAVHAGPYLLVPRVLAAACGVATIFFVYRLVDRVIDRLTALTAAFLVAVAFLFVRDSHFGVTDVPMTMLAVAALIPVTTVYTDPSRFKAWVNAGLLSGLTASTKYNGGLVIGAGLCVALLHVVQGDAARRRAALKGSMALVVAAIVAFLAGTPFAVLDWPHFFEGLRFDASHLMEGHGIVLGRGWIYHLTFSLRYGLGLPLLAAALAGIVVLAVKSWKHALLLCVFPVTYFLVIGRGYTVFVRYITPVVPFLCITAAVFIVETARRLSRPSWTPAVVAAASLAVAAPSIQRSVSFDRVIRETDTRVLALQWLEAHAQPDQWMYEAPPAILHPDFGIARPKNLASFDPNQRVFRNADGAPVTATWIVLPESPLSVYTVIPPGLQEMTAADYSVETVIDAAHGPEDPGWFDQQDLYFVPFTDFSMRDRPGPTIRILRHR